MGPHKDNPNCLRLISTPPLTYMLYDFTLIGVSLAIRLNTWLKAWMGIDVTLITFPSCAQLDGVTHSWNEIWGYILGGIHLKVFGLSLSGPYNVVPNICYTVPWHSCTEIRTQKSSKEIKEKIIIPVFYT